MNKRTAEHHDHEQKQLDEDNGNKRQRLQSDVGDVSDERSTWFDIDLGTQPGAIALPETARFVRIRGPGSGSIRGHYPNVKALIITDNADLMCQHAEFDNLTHLAATHLSHCSQARVKDDWLHPENFASMTHCYLDGCAPKMADYCMRDHVIPRNAPIVLAHSEVFEPLYAFSGSVIPKAPCQIVFPLSKRVRNTSGLGTRRVLLTGSASGWIVHIELDAVLEAVAGTNFHLGFGELAEHKITAEMEQETEAEALKQHDEVQIGCNASSRVDWDLIYPPHDLPDNSGLDGLYTNIIQSVTCTRFVQGEAVAVEIEPKARGCALLKALHEICGNYLLPCVRSKVFCAKMRPARLEFAPCFNSNVTFGFTTEDLTSLRSKLVQEFTDSVESAYF